MFYGKLVIGDFLSFGVTKGSFYSHFHDRKDFFTSLAVYRADTSTMAIIVRILEIDVGLQE